MISWILLITNDVSDKIGHNDIALMATNWDMYDTYELTQQLEEAANPNKQGNLPYL